MALYKFNIFKNYEDKISHAITSREIGTLSISASKEEGKKNRVLLSGKLGFEEEKTIYMNQIHSKEVKIINKNHDYQTILSCDGVVTNQKQTPLTVMVADCIPILFFDPINNAVGAVHAGRAGVFKNIIKETIESFNSEFKTNAKDLLVGIGPSIGSCCYEVGKEIADEAIVLGLDYAISLKNGRYFLDNTKIAKKQLSECGIKKENIEELGFCTGCNTDKFYSYRKENQKTGRFAGVIFLK